MPRNNFHGRPHGDDDWRQKRYSTIACFGFYSANGDTRNRRGQVFLAVAREAGGRAPAVLSHAHPVSVQLAEGGQM
jgi:hypothetical protein